MRALRSAWLLPIANFSSTRTIWSPTLMDGLRVSNGFWNTIWIEDTVLALRCCTGSLPIASPLSVASPAVAVSRPIRIFARVDLPQPDSPTIARISARRASKLTASLALTSRRTRLNRAPDVDLVVFAQPVDGQDRLADLGRQRALLARRRRVPGDLAHAQAAAVMPGVDARHVDALRVAAAGDEIAAARPEIAARRPLVRQREIAGNGDQRPRVLVRAGQRDRAEQRLGVGVPHAVEHFGDGAGLHRLAGIHDADAVAGLQHQPEIVGDEQHRGAALAPQLLDQLDDAGLDRDVERGGRLVEDEEAGPRHQRHRDHDALLLAAGELVRIGSQDARRIGQAHGGDDVVRHLLRHAGADALVDHRHFHQLLADRHRRIERRHRLLIDHRDLRAAEVAQLALAQRRHVAALEADRALGDAAGSGRGSASPRARRSTCRSRIRRPGPSPRPA